MQLWDSLESKVVYTKDVRQVLTYTETENVDAGMVYKTDALVSDKVNVVATADEAMHAPIIYPVGVLKASKHAQEAKDFITSYKVMKRWMSLKSMDLKGSIKDEYRFWSPLRLSIEIAFVAGIIAIIAGIFMGKWMATHNFKGKLVLETVLLLPLVLPPTVVGFLLIVMFGKNSMLGHFIIWLFDQPIMFTWWAAVIASTIVAFPLMYQSAKTGFASVDRDIENAARVDGANEWQVFLYVSIPLHQRHLFLVGF